MTAITLHKRKPLTGLQRAKLFDVLNLDVTTGVFTWKKGGGHCIAGRIAGSIDSHGYRQITIDKRPYLAHRLVWLWCKGVWPTYHLDHINGDILDNRMDNLREATFSQNCANAKRRKDNTMGLKGVSKHGKRFRAQIQVNKKKRCVGVFDTPEQAHEAYMEAARNGFGAFARAS